MEKSKKNTKSIGRRKRKIFYYNGDKKKPICAGGLLLLKKGKSGYMLYMAKTDIYYKSEYEVKDGKIYCDIGGKTDNIDKSIYDTIFRELIEETNNSIFQNKKYLSKKELKKILYRKIKKKIYIRKGKYLVVVIELLDDLKIDYDKVGDLEKSTKIKRKFEWISINKFLKFYKKKILHARLMNKQIFEYFRSLTINC